MNGDTFATKLIDNLQWIKKCNPGLITADLGLLVVKTFVDSNIALFDMQADLIYNTVNCNVGTGSRPMQQEDIKELHDHFVLLEVAGQWPTKSAQQQHKEEMNAMKKKINVLTILLAAVKQNACNNHGGQFSGQTLKMVKVTITTKRAKSAVSAVRKVIFNKTVP